MTLFSIIKEAGWPIIPLLLCSILAVAIIIERFMALRAEKVVPARLVEEAIAVSRNGVPTGEVISQLEANSLLGEVLAAGMRTLGQNPRTSEADLRASMESAGRMAAHKLEKFLNALATIAAAGPLLGLLGTVIGMIEIFGSQGGAAGMGGAGSNPAQLAHGISIALYNTATGLLVAIPALIFWKYFRSRADDLLLRLELGAERYFRHLNSLRK